jgi:hypothetical protein
MLQSRMIPQHETPRSPAETRYESKIATISVVPKLVSPMLSPSIRKVDDEFAHSGLSAE